LSVQKTEEAVERKGQGETSTGSPELFARKSSGFIREISWVTAMFIGMGFIAFYELPIAYLGGMYASPNGLAILGSLLMWVVLLPHAYIWTKISQAFPRSGADYVFISRVLHPAIGAGTGITFALCQTIFDAAVTYFGIVQLQTSFNALGLQHGGAYASIATELSVPLVAWALGALMFTGLILISMFATKHLNRIFAVFSIIAVLAFVVNTVVIEFSNTGPFLTFIANNGYSLSQISTAAASATPLSSNVVLATLGLMVFAASFFPFLNGATSVAGEVRGGSKSFTKGILLAVVVTGLLSTWFISGAVANLGSKFFVGAGATYISGQSSYSALTNPVFDAILMTNNIGLQLFLTISSFFWYLATVLAVILFISRYLMAVAFDKVLPTRIAYVSERFHSPMVAHGVDLVVTLTALTIITLTPLSTSFFYGANTADLMAMFFGFILGALVVVYSVAKKDGVLKGNRTLILVAALVDVVVLAIYAGYWVLYAPIYLGTVVNPTTAAIIVSPFVGGVVLYYAMRAWRLRHEGLDLNNTFKEIPPE
jgi:amino acid transporter